MRANTALPLPTFSQAGRFAQCIGIRTETDWQRYTTGMTREDLFQRVLSVISGRIVTTELEN